MTHQEKKRAVNLLAQNEECHGLSQADLAAFIPISRFTTYVHDQVIFSESQPAKSFFILEKGYVNLNFSRREPVKINRGQMFGDWAIINDTVRLATAVVKSNTSVLEIDAIRFFDHAYIPHSISLSVVKIIARKLIQRLQSRSLVSTRILIENGETDMVEFKSTLRKNLKTNTKDAAIEHAVLKTIAGFLNSRGGTLLVGVQDDGLVSGIAPDEFANPDKYLRHFTNLLDSRIGIHINQHIHYDLIKLDDEFVLRVDCDPSPYPIFVKEGNTEFFYVRNGASTLNYSLSEALKYIRERY